MEIRYSNCSLSTDKKIVVKEKNAQVSEENGVFFTGYPQAKEVILLKKFFCKEGQAGQGSVEIQIDLPNLSEAQIKKVADLIILSLYEGAYKFQKECLRNWNPQDIFKKRDEMAFYGNQVFTLVSDVDLSKVVEESQTAAKCMGYARTLGNLPHNYLQIPDMVRYATELAEDCGMKYTVLRDAELKELGCGGILAVNQGSDNEAAMVVLEWGEPSEKEKTALVGKGLMFDAGGYSIKSLSGMSGMKFDMCGSANILESMEIAARLGYKGELIGVIGLVENLISPQALKPGDVIHMLSGKSIEVYNPDAEGRLVLGDALTYVQRMGATKIIDMATLTSGVSAALGRETAGIFSNDDDMYEAFAQAMKISGERGWRLPVGDIYADALLWSNIADIGNYGLGFEAGASTAASFLGFFIEEGTKWIHLDVASAAVERGDLTERAKGATGVCVKAIREWLMEQ